MDRSSAAILQTLCYSDIFDYPLTKAEVWRFLPYHARRYTIKNFEKDITALLQKSRMKYQNGYYFLPGRREIVAKRQERQRVSRKKIERAKQVSKVLSRIPTIQLIAISGSLAMKNTQKNADIDLFIITKTGTLWITRLLVLLVLELLRVRRSRQMHRAQNMVCPNMFVDMQHLAFPKKRQDVYSAHEIVQMIPVISRGYSYERFLKENSWVRNIVPFAYPGTSLKAMLLHREKGNTWLRLLDPLAKYVQILYMRKYQTTEDITHGFVAFHPNDYKEVVLEAWEKRKHTYGI